MIDLYRFFVSPFDEESISLTELTSYGDEHLAAMVANNPGGTLNNAITVTGNLLTALGSSTTSTTVKLGLQKAAAQVKAEFRETLPNPLSKIHGACLAQYGRRGAAMLEIFPGGLDAFHSANDDQLEDLLAALATALQARTAELTSAPGAQAEALRATWAGLYGAVTTAKAGRSTAAENRRVAGKTLRTQLFKNLLLLVTTYPGQPEKAQLYCPQHLLEQTSGGGGGGEDEEEESSSSANPPMG